MLFSQARVGATLLILASNLSGPAGLIGASAESAPPWTPLESAPTDSLFSSLQTRPLEVSLRLNGTGYDVVAPLFAPQAIANGTVTVFIDDFPNGSDASALQLLLDGHEIASMPVEPMEWPLPGPSPTTYNPLVRFDEIPVNAFGQYAVHVVGLSPATIMLPEFFTMDLDQAAVPASSTRDPDPPPGSSGGYCLATNYWSNREEREKSSATANQTSMQLVMSEHQQLTYGYDAGCGNTREADAYFDTVVRTPTRWTNAVQNTLWVMASMQGDEDLTTDQYSRCCSNKQGHPVTVTHAGTIVENPTVVSSKYGIIKELSEYKVPSTPTNSCSTIIPAPIKALAEAVAVWTFGAWGGVAPSVLPGHTCTTNWSELHAGPDGDAGDGFRRHRSARNVPVAFGVGVEWAVFGCGIIDVHLYSQADVSSIFRARSDHNWISKRSTMIAEQHAEIAIVFGNGGIGECDDVLTV